MLIQMSTSLYSSWLVGWLLKKVDNDVKKFGVVEAMQKTINSKINLNVCGRSLVKKVLMSEPGLVICNHPSQAEVLILLGLLEERDDVYLIADHSFLKILPSVDRHIIPVYINHRLAGKQKDSWKFWLLTRFHKSEKYCQEIAHQKNIDSMNLAAEKINQGGLVIIFPAAGEMGGKFLNGVGYIIKNLTHPKKVSVVMANVSGTSTWDYLRLIPGINWLLPKINFNFAKPLSINKFMTSNPKETTKCLEDKYYNWVRG